MPYAVRNAAGDVVSLHRHDPGVGEHVAADAPEVLTFLGLGVDTSIDTSIDTSTRPWTEPAQGSAMGGGAEAEADNFDRLDAEFIRVLEDVIDALTSRNLINITDLPEVAQVKLFNRRSFRERRPSSALDLFRAGDLGDVI